jgi:hypothetical protein
MRFFMKWLKIERPAGVALHPTRTVELDAAPEDAFDRCLRGIEHVLGGIVRESDRARGRIEASFGLVNSERMTVTVQELQPQRSRVVIEARRGASFEPAKPSQYVTALAQYLQPQ